MRDRSSDQHGVALEDHDVPEARGVVEAQRAGEEAREDVAQVVVGWGPQVRGGE